MVKFISTILSVLITLPIVIVFILLLTTLIAPFLAIISLIWFIALPFICLVHMFGSIFDSIRNNWKSKNNKSTKEDDVDYYRNYTVLDDGTIDMHISTK